MKPGTKGAATTDQMGKLHDVLAKKLNELIVNGETTVQAGKEKTAPVSAAVLAVARGFLKDNGVECDPGLPSRPVGELASSVSELLEDENVPEFTN